MKSIYIRTSTEDQEPENQIKNCKSMFEGEYLLFKDKQSAWKDNKERENFSKLKKEIKSNKISDLYVWDLDRIYRNRIKLKQFFEFCQLCKCKIHSFNQRWLEQLNNIPEPFNEIMHELMLNLMGWLAEDESKKKSERVKLAVRKVNGVTKSYKGNKWGRKSLSTQKLNKLKRYAKEHPKSTIRQIAQELNISKSVVHKYLTYLTKKKTG